MEDYLIIALKIVEQTWSFFAIALVVAVLVKFFQELVKRVKVLNRPASQFVVDSKLFPGLIGVLIGLIPGTPVPELIGSELSIAHVLYFGVAGIIGSWVYGLAEKLFVVILPVEIKQWIEKKLGTEGDPVASPVKKSGEEEGIDDDTEG